MSLVWFNPNDFSSLEPELYYPHFKNKKTHANICTELKLNTSFQQSQALTSHFESFWSIVSCIPLSLDWECFSGFSELTIGLSSMSERIPASLRSWNCKQTCYKNSIPWGEKKFLPLGRDCSLGVQIQVLETLFQLVRVVLRQFFQLKKVKKK